MNLPPLNLVILKEHNLFVVQWLEKDLAAQGRTLEKALQSFANVYYCEINMCLDRGLVPFQTLNAAPDRYQQMFKTGVPLDPARACALMFPREQGALLQGAEANFEPPMVHASMAAA